MRLYVLLIAHMLADFTLQTNKMAQRKKKELKILLLHSAVYTVLMAIACFFSMDVESACGMVIWFGATHLCIDYVRIEQSNDNRDSLKELKLFVGDQVLHIGAILFACWLLQNQWESGCLVEIAEKSGLVRFLQNILWEGCTLHQLLRYILLLVTIMDPASIWVKQISYVTSNKMIDETEHGINHAGSLIGKLERLIIALLVMNEAYGSIGFVLTAKSLARYKKLEEQEFAESYLVGTLSSTAIAMVLAQLLG